uniref:Uncharacterized protein n=1 Tax=Anguilla anguilla TaxID=7936 RepID=A0A0E9RIG8_ANGAN
MSVLITLKQEVLLVLQVFQKLTVTQMCGPSPSSAFIALLIKYVQKHLCPKKNKKNDRFF